MCAYILTTQISWIIKLLEFFVLLASTHTQKCVEHNWTLIAALFRKYAVATQTAAINKRVLLSADWPNEML